MYTVADMTQHKSEYQGSRGKSARRPLLLAEFQLLRETHQARKGLDISAVDPGKRNLFCINRFFAGATRTIITHTSYKNGEW